ncbi:single-stranded-DNA-specific exonuclease RecJ [Candidatus Rhabdochlamydia sp. T3358]|uniref:single-stranded-DNA-specific exonuclease RecJ n=1 Tax=Candidatus Rhabdochlamydia sp. T3358 TaxID=2099795 RepID=UPI0010B9EAF2|nr:single-stranded-DNA-specific exonuclease RecJ [Candidatus Rhabdochlamydia sp. T3358]VHO04713.1 Single-stranded-DNA-specific exonuclease RecJ [Candidatus Rhabdochlamydia sp. T3358]
MILNYCDPIWVYPKVDPEWHKTIIKEFSIHPVIAYVLASRNFKTLEEIHDFLYAKLPHLFDPHLFPDMDKAVHRVLQALSQNENILIYGDNDVDGITATALLTEFLRFIGGNVFFYIPNRNSLKQSLILDAIDFALQKECKLIITVDCGITAANEIEEAVKKKIDVIVTDHHEPTAKLPHCIATLNPKLLNSTYPYRHLTGVGVAFKLAHATTKTLIANGSISPIKIDLKHYLDLVALGTIADMGSLLGENRILVRYGLRQMRKSRRIGLAKLFSICSLKPGEITPIDIASKVAPRLNSLGRIADPLKGVELLLIRDANAAEALAKELDLNNIERQKIERRDSEDVEQYILRNPQILHQKAIVISSDKWHPGIIPIITARIAKQYNRPTVVISIDQGLGKGSIRTIPEFPLLQHLRESSDLLENFGGHDFAAGLTIKEENIPAFKEQFIKAANLHLKDQDIIAKIYLNANIQFGDLTFDFMESFNLLEPFGNENPAPILYCDAKQIWPPKIVGKTHLKLYLEQQDRMLEGIAFGMADKRQRLLKKKLMLHIAFTPHINNFLNKSSIQLQIRDFQLASFP